MGLLRFLQKYFSDYWNCTTEEYEWTPNWNHNRVAILPVLFLLSAFISRGWTQNGAISQDLICSFCAKNKGKI